MRIKEMLESHKKLNYLQRCIRRINDSIYVENVLSFDRDPLRMHILQLGEKNPGKLIYVAQTLGCDGLFAELRYILSEFYFADCFGFLPVALIPKESCYYEDEPINGTTNPFEYYFSQPSGITYEEAMESAAVVEHNFVQRDYMWTKFGMKNGYLPTDEYFECAAAMVKKYMRLNAETAEYIQRSIQILLKGKKTLAVHVRGGDFKKHYTNHPEIITIQEYVEAVKEAIVEVDFEQIFLATDDLDAIDCFQQEFGERVVYFNDVVRTRDDDTVMHSKINRENHKYLLGLEVVRDVYTLAAAEGIIAGLSNVSIFARIVKKSAGEDYAFMNYVNKGINYKR